MTHGTYERLSTGVTVAGESDAYGSGGLDFDYLLIRLNADGDTLGMRFYWADAWDRAHAVELADDGKVGPRISRSGNHGNLGLRFSIS